MNVYKFSIFLTTHPPSIVNVNCEPPQTRIFTKRFWFLGIPPNSMPRDFQNQALPLLPNFAPRYLWMTHYASTEHNLFWYYVISKSNLFHISATWRRQKKRREKIFIGSRNSGIHFDLYRLQCKIYNSIHEKLFDNLIAKRNWCECCSTNALS